MKFDLNHGLWQSGVAWALPRSGYFSLKKFALNLTDFTEEIKDCNCNCHCNFSTGSPLSNTDFQWSPAAYIRTKNITYNMATQKIELQQKT